MLLQNLTLPLRKPKRNTNKKLYDQVPIPVPCQYKTYFSVLHATVWQYSSYHMFLNIVSEAFNAQKEHVKIEQ